MQHITKVRKIVTAARMMGVYGGVIAILLMLCVAGSPESTWSVFGPYDFVRVAGQPATTTVSFPVRSPALRYTLHIDNGGSYDTLTRVSSAVVTLNGMQVAGPSDFNQTVRELARPVTLAATNTLTVELRSAPGSGFTLQIVGTGRQNTPPVANAGPDQTVFVGTQVQLDGSKSSDGDGDLLTFHWSFLSIPSGSTATLSDPTAVQPTFTVDRPGTYTVQLLVSDDIADSAPATVAISTENSPPVANAGPHQTVFVGTTVALDGSQSSDVDGDLLTYRWSFTALPTGSTATLSDPTAVAPTFGVDRPGTYVAQLIVHDSILDSAPATVTITTQNSRPIAHAGPAQTVVVGTTVTLDGSASSDADGDPFTFRWALTAVPTGSAATLSDPTAVAPTFGVDQAGTYVAQLIVNDGILDSAPATVTITAYAPPPPPLSAGQLTLSGITTGLVTVTGAPGAAPAGTTVVLTNTGTGQTVTGTVQANGSFTLQIAAQEGDTLSFIVMDASGQRSPATTVTVGSGLPPDPSTVAPPLDQSVASTLATATAFLSSGA